MKKWALLSMFFFFWMTGFADSQEHIWKWVKSSVGTVYFSGGYGISADSTGDVYVLGKCAGRTITFDTIQVTQPLDPKGRMFMVKYDSLGHLLWAKSHSGVGSGICTDAAGNFYITGDFETDTFFFANDTFINKGVADMFVAKFDPSGNPLWARCAGGKGGEQGASVALDAGGNIYVTGAFQSRSITFGNITLTHRDTLSSAVFTVKYDPLGNVVWAKGTQLSDTISGFSVGQSIAVSAAGEATVFGNFTSPEMKVDNITLVNNGGYNAMFIVKYDAAGNVLWAKNTDGNTSGYGNVANGVGIDAAGNAYLAGYFGNPTLTFDTITLTNAGGNDMFIAKYNAQGNVVWAKRAGGNDYDFFNGISTDAAGNSYVAGYFASRQIVLGGDSVFNVDSPATNIVVIKYDSMGNVQWTKQAGGSRSDVAYAITSDAAGRVYTTGWVFSAASAFGHDTVIIGPTDVAVYTARIADTCIFSPQPVNTTITLIVDSGSIDTLTATGRGTLGWYSADSGGVYLGSGSTFVTPVLTDTTTFYVQDSICGASARTPITVIVTYCYPAAPPIDISDPAALLVDSNTLDTLVVTGAGIISWYSAISGGTYIGSGNTFTILVLHDTTLYVQDSTCGVSTRTVIKIGVRTSATGLVSTNRTGNIRVSPNPTAGIIHFKGIEKGNKVEVYNVLGEVIHASISTAENYSVDLSGNSKGIYFYRVTNNAGAVGQGKVIMK